MKYWQKASMALVTGVAAASLATTADAQTRQRIPPRTQTTVPGPNTPRMAVPRQSGAAMPRVANPNDWRRFESGIRRNDRNFSIGFAYYSGSPFGINNMIPYYGGMPGYFNGDLWYPLCFGPRPLTRWEIVNEQWYNISRFGPTVGDMRTMRYSMAAGDQYGYAPQGQTIIENPVNEDLTRENEELREWKRQHELEDAERRGYERGRAEAQPVQQQVTDRIKLSIEYGGNVAKVQYAGVAKDFYNFGLFEGLRKVSDGDINLVAYAEDANKLVIRDENDGLSNLLHIDMSSYPGCMNVDALLDNLTSGIINSIGIDKAKVYSARASIDIAKSSYSACSTSK